MKLIIDIPEEQYRTLNAKMQEEVVAVIDNKVIITAVKNGTPLSESEDCVSRQALDDILDKWAWGDIKTDDLDEKIKALPPVIPKQRLGQWIETKAKGGMTMPCCSLCGNETGTIYKYDYCPNCGAKMGDE